MPAVIGSPRHACKPLCLLSHANGYLKICELFLTIVSMYANTVVAYSLKQKANVTKKLLIFRDA